MNRRNLSWVPAFIAGAAAATAAELAAGLLLYSGLGFLRALTVVLAVLTLAFALGLWTARTPAEEPGLDRVRRRWLFAMVAFTGAALFALGWAVLGQGSAGGAGQGLGLAVLGGLPLFAVGALLGSMGRLSESAPAPRREGADPPMPVGAAAATGAAAGFLLTGFLFVPNLQPPATLLACVVGLSAGALLHGWILEGRELPQVLETRWTPRGQVRVEDRLHVGPGHGRRVLLEAGRLRGAECLNGKLRTRWEDAVLEWVAGADAPPASVLVYGLGAGTLARGLVAAGVARVLAVEPNVALSRIARAHFPPGRDRDADPWSGVDVRSGLELHEVAGLSERFHVAVVDTTVFPGQPGRLPPVTPGSVAPLARILAPGGSVVLVGAERFHAEGLGEWMSAAREHFAACSTVPLPVGTVLVLGATDTGPWRGARASRSQAEPPSPATPQSGADEADPPATTPRADDSGKVGDP